MPFKIQSIIETEIGGCDMDNNKKRHTRHYKSEATSDKNRLFHQTKTNDRGITQTTTVNVTVHDEPTDCFSSCFKGLAGLFIK